MAVGIQRRHQVLGAEGFCTAGAVRIKVAAKWIGAEVTHQANRVAAHLVAP